MSSAEVNGNVENNNINDFAAPPTTALPNSDEDDDAELSVDFDTLAAESSSQVIPISFSATQPQHRFYLFSGLQAQD